MKKWKEESNYFFNKKRFGSKLFLDIRDHNNHSISEKRIFKHKKIPHVPTPKVPHVDLNESCN